MTTLVATARLRTGRPVLVWALGLTALMRLVTLGLYPLADTTEARYAEIARKMVKLGDWSTPWYDNGVPFWAKPTLSTCMSAMSFKLLGVNEIAERLPHFLAAIVSVGQGPHRRGAGRADCGAVGSDNRQHRLDLASAAMDARWRVDVFTRRSLVPACRAAHAGPAELLPHRRALVPLHGDGLVG